MSVYLKHFTAVGDNHKAAERRNAMLREVNAELTPATEEPPRVTPTFRDSLKRLFASDRFQIAVVCLVILDAIFVLGELLIDLSIIKLEHGHIAPQIFHYMSLALLTFFMVELAAKLFAFRLEFFHHKFEVFDGVVVIVSFILDIVFITSEDAFDGMGLLILLRLWRVARIINGILLSVKANADHKIHKLTESNDQMVKQLTELQEKNNKTEEENKKLRAILEQHAIEF
ncbi:hypothetical protein DPEC_G00197950 [Dallia pectoralis]|uniref:Uncharacterized protein n=1 Tax=Dallia pectoralis TaxID=75939 RepID=A0ACC2G812_DALPE|nr:hypothetical protein DPEC_G00197950 [Dallia pectoralis]